MAEKPDGTRKNDWGTKILAVVLALMLWFYVDAERIQSMNLDVPVQYVNLPEGYTAENGVSTVRITVRGEEADLSGLRGTDFSAKVDLSQAEIGTKAYPIQVTAPNLAEHFTYRPSETRLTIDEVVQKSVPVELRTTGELPAGYELAGVRITPETVTVEGRSQALSDITYVAIRTIDLSGVTATQEMEVPLLLADGVLCSHDKVTVRLNVQEIRSQRVYEGEIELRNVPDGYTVTLGQQSASATFTGSASQLAAADALRGVALYVDCRNVAAGQQQLTVQVEYTGPLALKSVSPGQVQASVTAPEQTGNPTAPEGGAAPAEPEVPDADAQ